MSSGKYLGSSMGNKSQSIHENLMRESKDDVFKKYETLEILGQGSMVSVKTQFTSVESKALIAAHDSSLPLPDY